jgi:hypothetical protein
MTPAATIRIAPSLPRRLLAVVASRDSRLQRTDQRLSRTKGEWQRRPGAVRAQIREQSGEPPLSIRFRSASLEDGLSSAEGRQN